MTQATIHTEESERSFILPTAGWSHFLAPYILGNGRSQLCRWFDRPWGAEKFVAAIQARDDENLRLRV